MTLWKTYHLARSIQEALEILSAAEGPARPIAGGTDLLLDMQQGRYPPVETLVDITAIPELACLELRRDKLFVGAAVPLNRIVRSSLVQEHAQALVEACALIGGPQVRNTATLGGNVAHALPAADGTIALLALDAQVEIASLQGQSSVPLNSLFLGPGRSALDARHELLVGFHLPLISPGQGSAFKRVMRPQGVALPILNLSAWLHRREEHILDLRLAIGPGGPTPFRGLAAEAILRGERLTLRIMDRALEALLAEARFRTSPHRATVDYRRHLTGSLLEESLLAAWARAGSGRGEKKTAEDFSPQLGGLVVEE